MSSSSSLSSLSRLDADVEVDAGEDSPSASRAEGSAFLKDVAQRLPLPLPPSVPPSAGSGPAAVASLSALPPPPPPHSTMLMPSVTAFIPPPPLDMQGGVPQVPAVPAPPRLQPSRQSFSARSGSELDVARIPRPPMVQVNVQPDASGLSLSPTLPALATPPPPPAPPAAVTDGGVPSVPVVAAPPREPQDNAAAAPPEPTQTLAVAHPLSLSSDTSSSSSSAAAPPRVEPMLSTVTQGPSSLAADDSGRQAAVTESLPAPPPPPAVPAELPYAVTTLLPGGLAATQSPSLLPLPSALAATLPPLAPASAPLPRFAPSALPVQGVSTAGSAAAAAPPAPSPATPKPERKAHHLRRTRDILESADHALFTSPDGADKSVFSASSNDLRSSSSDSDEDNNVYVGRTHRIGNTSSPAHQRQRRAKSAADAVAAEERRTATKHARRSHRSKSTVVQFHVVEGKSTPSSSREKSSFGSHSTNALTPDSVAKTAGQQQRRRSSTHANQGDGAAAQQGESSEFAVADAGPLTFVGPAARMQARCQASTRNKGPTWRVARRLTRKSLLGYGNTGIEQAGRRNTREEEEEQSDNDEEVRPGTVHFRVTGAFSDDNSEPDPLLLQSGKGEEEASDLWLTGRTSSSAPAQIGGASSNAGATDTTVLALTVRGMSPLHADVGVVHPFVRAWVVSCVTGKSLVQATAAVPCAVTQPFDIRARKTRTPWWEATVALRLSTERLRSAASDAMLLLEVLDFGNETIHGFPLLRQGLYPICWGFLMLRDCTGRSNLIVGENVHLQLYRYPLRTPWYLTWVEALLPASWAAAGAQLRPRDLGKALGLVNGSSIEDTVDVPSIYQIFKHAASRKVPYEGGMVVHIRQSTNGGYVPETTDMLPYEEYLLNMLVSGGGSSAVPRSTRSASLANRQDSQDEAAGGGGRARRGSATAAVPASPWAATSENYYRMDGERSLLPHEVLQTTAVLGIVTCVAFAHNGTLFATGVDRHLQYVVELRNPMLPEMPVVATMVGHTGHIHRVVFQKEDRYMLSCSSDGTVRVWQPTAPNSPFSSDKCTGPSSVQCVCTLPHGFPVYAAIFHQDKVVTGGFSDQLFVWGYERLLHGEMASMVTAEENTLHLTATFTPELHVTQDGDAPSKPTHVLLGELVHRVDNAGATTEDGEPTITLSLASNERSNRVWSVHANGAVVCWRAIGKSSTFDRSHTRRGSGDGAGEPGWEMSVRHKADCDGASEVQVSGSYAIVVCGHAPLVFVFDATTCEQLRVVNTRLPPATPITLLPDGEAFVSGAGDPSRFVAWECFDGALCTAPTGYARGTPLFGVMRMSWAESQQLTVMVSRSPCTEEDMVRYVNGASAPAPGQSAAAYYYWQQEQQYRLKDVPSEMTLITVAGTVRRRANIIQTTDTHASEAFCAMFGGDLRPKRKAAYLAQRTLASRQRESERDTRKARLHQESVIAENSVLFAATAGASVPYDATEKGARMNAIINFWRGLVGQHRHAAEDLQTAEKSHDGGTQRMPHRASARRVLRYVDDDDEEDETVDV